MFINDRKYYSPPRINMVILGTDIDMLLFNYSSFSFYLAMCMVPLLACFHICVTNYRFPCVSAVKTFCFVKVDVNNYLQNQYLRSIPFQEM